MAIHAHSTTAPARRLLPSRPHRPELPTPPLLDRRAIAADGWARAREMAKTYGGTPRDHLAAGQRLAWSAARRTPPDVAGSKLHAALEAIQVRHDAAADVRRDLEALISTAEVEADVVIGLTDLIGPADKVAQEARALHLRRQLEAAAEHGANLLAALSLPQLVGPDHIQLDPAAAGDALDQAIAALDALDGDTDFEDGHDVEHDTADLEDDGTAEHALGAPERHPYVQSIGSPYYDAADGSYRRIRQWESQASWAQGSRQDGEGENEPGYDLPEGDGSASGEDDDDGNHLPEGDDADHEPWLASAAGDGDQEHWCQGDSRDHEDVTAGDGQAPADWYARPIGPLRPDVHGYQHEREMRALAREAEDVKRRLHPEMGRRRDPDEVVFIAGTFNGMAAMWGGPVPRHPSNLREIGA